MSKTKDSDDEIFVKEDATVYRIKSGWSYAIEWSSPEQFSEQRSTFDVTGWQRKKPERGDLLDAPMKSGKTSRFVFLSVTNVQRVHDMFFGVVGYIGEAPKS